MVIDLPPAERPRERCLESGAAALSLRECIALILGSGPRSLGCMGLAAQVLAKSGGPFPDQEQERAFFLAMEVAPRALLASIRGLGPCGQARLIAAFELGRRYSFHIQRNQPPPTRHERNSISLIALSKVGPMVRSRPQEWLGFVPIYSSETAGELCIVETGARTHVNVDPVELFARILALRPQGFFLFHNHPSGDTTPSEMDFELTRCVSQVSQSLGIGFLGHWVVSVGRERWIDPHF